VGRTHPSLNPSPLDRAIPERGESPNWRSIPILGNDVPLVPLVPARGRFDVSPVYHILGIPGARETVRVRADVSDALLRAVDLLPESLGLRVHDGWRPVAVQKWLWDREWERLRRARPDLSALELETRVGHFVALPDASPDAPPPHRSGGAVDVVLFSVETGQSLDFGTPFDASVPESSTRFFEQDGADPEVRAARRILYHAMESVGFANYAGEWWHFDLGNQRWANLRGLPHARHGIPLDE